ncbi:MAG: hypothetical protein ACREOG_04860, partial [Gemmatimonadaceae bacterium]
MRPFLLPCVVLLVADQALQAQTTDLQQRAAQAWFAGDWVQAAELYATLSSQTPNVALPHFRLGAALVTLKRHGEARAHLETADRLGFQRAQVA